MMLEAKINNKVNIQNKSKTYLMPLLSAYIDISFIHLIKNTFIKFEDRRDYNIGILYELPNESESYEFYKYIEYLKEATLFNDKIEFKNYILLTFHFPEEFLYEFDCYREGRYSLFSRDAKKIIITFTADSYMYSKLTMDVTQILYKNKHRKEQLEQELGLTLNNDSELTSKMLVENETFKLDNYI